MAELLLSRFDITENGFLPSSPIQQLPSDPFLEWEKMVTDLPETNNNRTTRQRVMELPDLSSSWENMTDLNQIKRAYVVTSLISNSYIFNGPEVESYMPPIIAIPLCVVSKKLGITPILTHAAVDLFNWRLIDPKGTITLDNLKSVSLMTGLRNEEWFYLVMVEIEAHGGIILRNIAEIMELLKNQDADSNVDCGPDQVRDQICLRLKIICDTITTIEVWTLRMYEHGDPVIFFDQHRPYLKGWKNNDDLPNGMTYGGVSDEPAFYEGGSAAQSSLIQVIDEFLGIEHKNTYFKKIRPHMPRLHREFIIYVHENSKLKEYVMGSPDSNNIESPDDLKDIYQECYRAHYKFRGVHYKLAYDYIISILKRRAADREERFNANDVDGSGGTKMVPFLKTYQRETKL